MCRGQRTTLSVNPHLLPYDKVSLCFFFPIVQTRIACLRGYEFFCLPLSYLQKSAKITDAHAMYSPFMCVLEI